MNIDCGVYKRPHESDRWNIAVIDLLEFVRL